MIGRMFGIFHVASMYEANTPPAGNLFRRKSRAHLGDGVLQPSRGERGRRGTGSDPVHDLLPSTFPLRPALGRNDLEVSGD